MILKNTAATFTFAFRASLVAQMVKNPPAMWDTLVLSLGWEDTLEKGKATHSSILGFPGGDAGDPGSIPGLGRYPGEGKGYPLQDSCLENPIQSMGSQRVGHD